MKHNTLIVSRTSPHLDLAFNRAFALQTTESFPITFQHEGVPCGIFLSWKLLILLKFEPALTGLPKEFFYFQQSMPKPKLSSFVTLTAENWLKQYLIKIIFEVLTYKVTAIGVLGRSNSPSGELSFWGGDRRYAVLQVLGTACAAQQALGIPPDSWCNFSKILDVWRTDSHSKLS